MKSFKAIGILAALVAVLSVVLPVLAADREQMHITELTLGDPGVVLTATATELNNIDGGVAGSVVASKAIVASSVGSLLDADLILDSTNEMNLQIGGVGALAIDDAAITANAAATDTVGQDIFIETQDGGGTPTAARVGGSLSIKLGDGSAAVTTIDGGAGGGWTLAAGDGGVQSGGGASGVGGPGGPWASSAGAGATTDNTGTDNAGNGGDWDATGGVGGAATGAGDSDGGDGGDVNFTAGLGGASTGGAVGAPGKVKVVQGRFEFVNAQTIDMLDGTLQITVDIDSLAGTLITSNILFVDATSGGGTEDLELPPEADCNGFMIFIINTGGETIVIKDDAAGYTVCTIATNEHAIVACDGTTWSGGVLQET